MARHVPVLALVVAALVAGPARAQQGAGDRPPAPPAGEARMAVVVLSPAPGKTARGLVRLTLVGGGLQVVADGVGLPPGPHALVAHELGDLTAPDGARAGGALAVLGSLEADARGAARLEASVAGLALAGPRGLLGRVVAVHERGPETPALTLGIVGLAADSTAPTVQVLAPQGGARINRNPVNVVVAVTDDVGVARVTIGGQPAQPDPSTPGRWRAALTVTPGEQRVPIEAADVAGNVGRAEATFAFNDRPPEVQAEATIVVEGRVDDRACTLTVNGQTVAYDKATGAWSARVPADPKAPARVTIVATDEYGNVRTEVRNLR